MFCSWWCPCWLQVSPVLKDFLGCMLTRDTLQRSGAAALLQHPFMLQAAAPRCLVPLVEQHRKHMSLCWASPGATDWRILRWVTPETHLGSHLMLQDLHNTPETTLKTNLRIHLELQKDHMFSFYFYFFHLFFYFYFLFHFSFVFIFYFIFIEMLRNLFSVSGRKWKGGDVQWRSGGQGSNSRLLLPG